MKTKTVSSKSGRLLAHLHETGVEYFDTAFAQRALMNTSEPAVRELLSDMTRRGLLLRIKQGLYCRIPYEQDPTNYIPDWHLLAEPLTQGVNHYIGYYSALQIHGLITQPSLKEQIVVAAQMKPSVLKVKELSIQFIYHNAHHFFGATRIWIDSFHQVSCSDVEKTIVDCLFKPDYAGGIVEVAKAIAVVNQRMDYQKLLTYVLQFESQAVIKRLGFLLEHLGLGQEILDQLHTIKTSSYVVLDTELPRVGTHVRRWSILQNIDLETIKSAVYT
jgi:predicted transcriptional regulator of viral defense system